MLEPSGYDKWVIKRQPELLFGTKPIGDVCKFEMGRLENGPNILPKLTSFKKNSLVSNFNVCAESKVLAIRGPVY